MSERITPRGDRSRSPWYFTMPTGNISAVSVPVTVRNHFTDEPISTATGLAIQDLTHPDRWYYPLDDINDTAIKDPDGNGAYTLETVPFAILTFRAEATLEDVGGTFLGTTVQNDVRAINGTEQQILAAEYNGQIVIDTNHPNASTDQFFPTGTARQPAADYATALAIQAIFGLLTFQVTGNITLTQGHPGERFIGVGVANINLAGQDVDGTEFKRCGLAGNVQLGNSIIVDEGLLGVVGNLGGITNIARVIIGGPLTFADGRTTFSQCMTLGPATSPSELDFNGSNAEVVIGGGSTGDYTARNGTDPGTSLQISECSGSVVLESTMTAGASVLSGVMALTDSSGAGHAVTIEALLNQTTVAGTVWDAQTAALVTAGSIGDLLTTNIDAATSSRAVPGDAMDLTAGAVDAIWDESLLAHNTFFTAGYFLRNVDLIVWAEATADIVTAGSIGEFILDNLAPAAQEALVTDAVWGRTEAQLLAAGETGELLGKGLSRNTFIDFVGNDALGWQSVTLNSAGSEIGRANLFDEAGARITGSVADFIDGKKTVARTTPL